jgi:hypothetical protein
MVDQVGLTIDCLSADAEPRKRRPPAPARVTVGIFVAWHSRLAILAAMMDLARTADVVDPCEEEW